MDDDQGEELGNPYQRAMAFLRRVDGMRQRGEDPDLHVRPDGGGRLYGRLAFRDEEIEARHRSSVMLLTLLEDQLSRRSPEAGRAS